MTAHNKQFQGTGDLQLSRTIYMFLFMSSKDFMEVVIVVWPIIMLWQNKLPVIPERILLLSPLDHYMERAAERRNADYPISIIDSSSQAPVYNNDAIICLYRQL